MKDAQNRSYRGLPVSIWALGAVSLLMDVSSEMIHGLLPVFLVASLGASTVVVGVIEGVGEAVANLSKPISGYISDRIGRRKPLALLGYGLAALSKPLFALAPTAGVVLGARVLDRLGKGMRGAPRDALVADIAPPDKRGAAFGLRQSLDSVGAFVGPLLAIGLMVVFAGNFQAVFWLASLPALMAVAALWWFVAEPDTPDPGPEPAPDPAEASPRGPIAALGPAVWAVALLGGVLTLARFTEAFLILRAESLGLALALAPLVLVAVNVVYALSAYPVGALSDQIGTRGLLMAGVAVLVVADLILAVAGSLVAVFAGALLWGLHMGLTQGLLAALVGKAAPPQARATAFGMFNLVTGLALLLASVIAGVLWEISGPPATFLASAGLAVAGLVGLLIFLPAEARPDS